MPMIVISGKVIQSGITGILMMVFSKGPSFPIQFTFYL